MHEDIIQLTTQYVKETLAQDSSGHDWQHIERVWKMARYLATEEKVDILVVELAALLHDIADWKFHDGDEEIGPRTARIWLEKLSLSQEQTDHVCNIIKNLSFKGAKVKCEMPSIEGKIVQDADRLDALGAIGIARTFAYGGHKGRPFYDFTTKPTLHNSFEEYKKAQSNTLNHFYEKLLLLKDLINTPTAKKIAEQRHQIMEKFLQDFLSEVNFN